MSLFARIFLVLLIVPFVELYLLLRIGDYAGFWPTLGGILFMAVAGSLLLRYQGLTAWRKFSTRLSSGTIPGPEIVDALIIGVSAILMITPGVLTDLVGITGLIPPIRAWYRKLILKKVSAGMMTGPGLQGGFFNGIPFGFPGSRPEPQETSGWSGSAQKTPSYRRSGTEANGDSG